MLRNPQGNFSVEYTINTAILKQQSSKSGLKITESLTKAVAAPNFPWPFLQFCLITSHFSSCPALWENMLKLTQPQQPALKCLSHPQHKGKPKCDKQVEDLVSNAFSADKATRHVLWAVQVFMLWSLPTNTCWHTEISRFHSPQVQSREIDDMVGNSGHREAWKKQNFPHLNVKIKIHKSVRISGANMLMMPWILLS